MITKSTNEIGARAKEIVTQLLKENLFVLLFLLVTILTVGYFLVPTFIQIGNITNVTRLAAVIGIIAIGETFVLLTGEVDLSIGSILSLSLVIGGLLVNVSPTLALIVTLLVGLFTGIANGIVVAKGRIQSFMVTLGALSLYGGLANIIVRGQAIYLYDVKLYQWLYKGSILGIPVPFVIFLLLTIIFSLFLKFTPTGQSVFFVGSNYQAARYSGIRVDRIKITAYALAGLCAAIAGPMISSQTNRITPIQGAGYELNAIAVAVLGGTILEGGKGSVLGACVGALIFSFLLNILALSGIGTYMEQVLKGLILIIIVIIFEKLNRTL